MSAAQAVIEARRIAHAAETVDDLELVLLPPVIWLPTLLEELHHRSKNFSFGVQNFYPKDEGAYTGEIGLEMIRGLAKYTLIGHSERRTIFGEDDDFVNEKVHAALRSNLRPIVCVGELANITLARRGRGRPTRVERASDILRQLDRALEGIRHQHTERLVVCYEPLWAIGTGKNVPGEHVQAVLEKIRERLRAHLGTTVAARVRTIYGGSVTEETVDEYIHQPAIDGVLVGGASLSAKTFLPIIQAFAVRSHHRIQHLDH